MDGHAVVVSRHGQGVRAACSCGARCDASANGARDRFTVFTFSRATCAAVLLAYRRLKKGGAA